MTTSTPSQDTRKYFFCRLIPPRPTFAADMTAEEARAMHAHVGYWIALAERGTAIVFGPVADPAGVWGVGIVAASSEEAMRELQRDDPAIRAGIGMRYDTLPMPQIVIGRHSGAPA
jgi:uncharacterized protein YciI